MVEISRRGARISSEVKPSEGEELTVRFTVPDYPEVFEVRVRVVSVQSDSWSMIFLEEPAGLTKLLRSLDKRTKKEAVSPISNSRLFRKNHI